MMKNHAKIIVLAVLIFIVQKTVSAQSGTGTPGSFQQDKVHNPGRPAAPGTYQFIVSPSEKGDPFTNDILVMIENYRDEQNERILPLTQSTKVRIPSRSSIQSPGYKPLKEIVYTQNLKPTSKVR